MSEFPIPATDVQFAARRFRFAIDSSGLLIVQVYAADGVTFLGQPVRFREEDGRLSGDTPGGLNGSHFHVNGTGQIALVGR